MNPKTGEMEEIISDLGGSFEVMNQNKSFHQFCQVFMVMIKGWIPRKVSSGVQMGF